MKIFLLLRKVLHGIIGKFNWERDAYERALAQLKELESTVTNELEHTLRSRVRRDILGHESM
jgi:hypothetical protein